MKKLLLLATSLFAGTSLFAQSNSIPNPGFENWTVIPYQSPVGYQSSDDLNSGNGNQTVINMFRTTDAYHGNYAVQLKSVKVGVDTDAAYIAIGNPGGNGATGGTPISGTPTGIRLYYKYTKKAPDTALVIAEFKKNGTIIGQYLFSMYDTTSKYLLFTQIFSPALTSAPDTVIFAAASSLRVMNNNNGNSSGYAPGSIFQIDSVSFTGIATQPSKLNGDFENWQNDSNITIIGWNNWMGSDSGNATRTTDAFAGKYAVQLVTGPCSGCGGGNANAQGITSGINPNGCCGPHGGLPYSMTKDTLEFYYKYTPAATYPGDTALVSLNVHNSSNNSTSFNIYLKSTGGAYVKEDYPFQAAGFTPDSVYINIQSSYSMRNTGGSNIPSISIGSTLKVDNMRFLSQLPVTISPANPSYCSGSNVILTASGATTYTWAPSTGLNTTNGATVTANPFGTTTYTVTGTTGTTMGTQKVVVTVNLPPTVNITPSSASICKGSSVNLTASGTSVSYTWSPLKGLNDSVTAAVVATPTATANYTVTGTSSAGCKGVNIVNVNVNSPPTASFTANTTCLGNATMFTNTSTGGTSYSWNFGDGKGTSSVMNPTYTYVSGGIYNVKLVVTGSTGCKDSLTMPVTVNPTPTITVTVASPTICSGSCTNITVSGATTYTWQPGGLNGSTINACPTTTSTYTVVGMSAAGCQATQTVVVTVTPSPTISVTPVNTTCGQSNGEDIANVISGGTSPFTYSWNTIPSQTTATATALTPGTYSVTVTDKLGCTANGSGAVSGSTAPSITVKVTPSNCGTKNGIAVASVTSGTSPYKYSWNNGDTLKKDSNLAAGVYIVTVTDKNGCSSFKAATVSDTNGPVLSVTSQTNNLCAGQSNGAITVSVTGGKTPYKYSWSNGATTASINGLQAGPYQVTVTDANGCSDVKTITITAPTTLALTTSTTQAACNTSNGGASVTVSGGTSPYTYMWSNASTSTSISNVAAGSYSVAITDKNGCTSSAVASVSNASGPVITITSVSDDNCSLGTKGSISISDTGGTPAYTYLWSNGLTTMNISNLTAGNYNVVVTDASGCKGTANATITEVLPPAISMCMVTVDPATNYNTIIWDKTNTKQIESYNIYKETTAPGLFTKIGSLKSDTTCIFIDKLSNSLVQSWRYEISQVDSCGNESPLSLPHKTMHLTINQGVGGAVNLIWDNYQGLAFGHYIVYRDSVAGIASDSIGSVINNGTYTFTNYPVPTSVHPWYYHMGISNPGGCTPAIEAINYNASKSNTGAIIVLGLPTLDAEINSFEVFPNPTTGKFNLSISLANEKQNVEIQVLNPIGQVLSQSNFNEVSGKLKKQIDLSGYSKGVYLVKVITANGSMYRKVVIQ